MVRITNYWLRCLLSFTAPGTSRPNSIELDMPLFFVSLFWNRRQGAFATLLHSPF